MDTGINAMGGAPWRCLEYGNRKSLCQHTDLEVDVGCGWNIHIDSCHWQPNEQLLCLDSAQVADGAILKLSRDMLAVICRLRIN